MRCLGNVIILSFHGHNYEIIVKLVGEPDPDTGVCNGHERA